MPCGKSKVWDKVPDRGPTPARDAYKGSPFNVNRQYAEAFGTEWCILEHKYGFISPDFAVPGPYNVTFKDPATKPITVAHIREQLTRMRLDNFDTIVGLGFTEYVNVIKAVFAGSRVEVQFPFEGLGLFDYMKAVKQTVESRDFHFRFNIL